MEIDNNNYNDNNNNSFDLSKLPMLALDEIPTPKADAKEITGLVKQSGRVTGYQLSDGSIKDKEDAVEMAKQGGIQGVGIANRKGNQYLKSLPDDNEGNNLGNLPSVSGSFSEESK